MQKNNSRASVYTDTAVAMALYGFRFVVINTKGFYGNGFHSLVFHWTVAVVGCNFCDFIYHIHAFNDFTKCSVLTVQMGRGLMHDEKLAACGVRDHGTRHGKNAFSMF